VDTMTPGTNGGDPLAVLQRIRLTRPPEPAADAPEVCELCSELIAPEHNHLVDLHSRALMCACRGCYLLFDPDGAGGGHFKSVPERYVSFQGSGFALTPAQWDRLQIPVSVAFFFLNSDLGRVAAFYPGPAGATESELPLDDWEQVVGNHQVLASMQPDVEAFLVRSRGGPGSRSSSDDGTECYIVPIDACYELVGHLRLLWRGFDGGSEANQRLDQFFDDVRSKAKAP
jgi:hypothetical protein